MKKSEINVKKEQPYPWKGFLVFLGVYLFAVGTEYPVMVSQAKIYLELVGGSASYTANEFAALAMIQPILLGVIAIYAGHRFIHGINLRTLTNEKLGYSSPIVPKKETYTLKDSVPFIVIFAFILALLNLGFDFVFQNWLPEMYQPNFSIPSISQALASIFYRGLGQEILLRFGVMTTIIYVLSSRGREMTPTIYTIGIIFTAILFTFAQYNSAAALTDFNFILIVRILLLNALDGILYGWLYYKFHFEAAVICHMLVNGLIILGNVLIVSLF